MLPGGLLDKSVELFTDGHKLLALYDGKVQNFCELPSSVIRVFLTDMLNNTEAMACLRKMGLKSISSMLTKYCMCRFGAFDGTPDMSEDKVNLIYEYWDCGFRESCPYQFSLCDRVSVGQNYLTKKQIEIVKLIATGQPDKIICDLAGVTYHTLITHKKNIYNRLGMHSQAEITAFAHKYNLV